MINHENNQQTAFGKYPKCCLPNIIKMSEDGEEGENDTHTLLPLFFLKDFQGTVS